jgi:hypothetical protein
VEDISEAIARIERYTVGLSLDAFLADTKPQDATVRNLEIIGEAIKGLFSDFRKKHRHGKTLRACAPHSQLCGRQLGYCVGCHPNEAVGIARPSGGTGRAQQIRTPPYARGHLKNPASEALSRAVRLPMEM